MQAEESASRAGAESASSSSRLSPVKGFVLVLILLAIVGGIFLLMRPDELAPSNIDPQPVDYSLTDAEAIARFTELQKLEREAFARADASLIPSIYTDGSPLLSKSLQSIQDLRNDGVRALFVRRMATADILKNTEEEIRIRQDLIFDIRFVSPRGEPVKQGGTADHQQIDWVLRLEDGEWLVQDAIIRKSEPVEGSAKAS